MSHLLGRTAAVAIAAAIVSVPAVASASPVQATGATGTTGTTVSAKAADASTMAIHRKSRKCNKPKGKRFNISWSPGGASTTFYFNNHCKGTNYIKVFYTDSVPRLGLCRTIKVKPGVKGHKRLWNVVKHNIDYVGFGKCP
ncbi:hypothetical protein E1287_09040 [Actinomadura sp. KC06]|uniref:hypothetical protein n=1 Tax=Actinomadura sp. KC06 TaxID=2530369 RepID=UPI0010474E44|nr:hypothetical protein [Actinomadura sp. KC06]TDD37292.1 hypothetical protein E1287_09040 [Actinomadura sp. KC06]